jgi:hypothetical protein
MRIYKILSIVFISILFSIVPIRIAQTDCGVGGRADKNYSLLHTENLPITSDYAPYLMGYGVVGDYISMLNRDAEYDDNIGEWRGRFCNIPDSAAIEYILYEASPDELADLRNATISDPKKNVFYQLEGNSFARIIRENGCTEVVDYLLYAKTCERYCVIGELWSDKPKDIANMFFLINRGRQEFKNTKSYFLKLRYAYQMIRLAHYAKDYKAVLQIYDDVMPKTEKINSIINYWILAHKAGALKTLGKRAEAAYLFGVVFRYCPSKRQRAFESFDIRTEGEWQQCLSLCKNNQERAALYAIRASYDKAKGLDDMIELHALDPKNEHLDMLLVRETLRLEKILLGHTFRRQQYSTQVLKQNREYCLQLIDFIRKATNSVKNPALWILTEGYLDILLGDWKTAKLVLADARKINKDATLSEQIDAFDLAARILAIQGTDEGMNTEFDAIRKSDAYLSDPDFEGLFLEKIGSIMRNTGNSGASFLSDYTLPDLEKYPKLDKIEGLIALCRKPDKSVIEKELVTLKGTKTIESQLWNIKGRYHLARFEMEAALEAFKNVPEEELGKKYTPFLDKIKDCVNCLQTDTVLVNRLEFTQKMLDMEYNIKAGKGSADILYYQLGLGYYNMTFFGNSSGLADFYRSGGSWPYLNSGRAAYPLNGSPLGNQEVTDVSLALQYFEKARQISPNREFQARCAFWCAKCEQNMFFTDKISKYKLGGKNIRILPPPYQRYFKLLKEYYSDTQYYKQASTECKYFRFYSLK